MASTNQIQHQSSYAKSVKNSDNNQNFDMPLDLITPEMDQGIILTTISEIPIRNYLIELSKIINPEKIQYASRMSRNRLFVFLEDKQSAKLVCGHKFLKVLNSVSRISQLGIPKFKITIHCSPTIPNTVLEEHFETIGLNVMSDITYLKIGIEDEFLSHIRSFRRQFFITLRENTTNIPEKTTIDYKNTKFPVFISQDTIRCTICNKMGHTENQCHQSNNIQNNKPIVQKPTSNENSQTKPEVPKLTLNQNSNVKKQIPPIMDQNQVKNPQKITNNNYFEPNFKTPSTRIPLDTTEKLKQDDKKIPSPQMPNKPIPGPSTKTDSISTNTKFQKPSTSTNRITKLVNFNTIEEKPEENSPHKSKTEPSPEYITETDSCTSESEEDSYTDSDE